MNTNDNPDSTAPLPDPQGSNFEDYVRNALATIIARLINVENSVQQLSSDMHQLSRHQNDCYVDLRRRFATLDEKVDAHLQEGIILKRDVQKLREKIDPDYTAR